LSEATAKKGHESSNKLYFSPSCNNIATPPETRSRTAVPPRSPSISPYKDPPTDNNSPKVPIKDKIKRKRQSEEITEHTHPPTKTSKMSPVRKNPTPEPEEPTTLDDIQNLTRPIQNITKTT
jgi:hypothetical protein